MDPLTGVAGLPCGRSKSTVFTSSHNHIKEFAGGFDSMESSWCSFRSERRCAHCTRPRCCWFRIGPEAKESMRCLTQLFWGRDETWIGGRAFLALQRSVLSKEEKAKTAQTFIPSLDISQSDFERQSDIRSENSYVVFAVILSPLFSSHKHRFIV